VSVRRIYLLFFGLLLFFGRSFGLPVLNSKVFSNGSDFNTFEENGKVGLKDPAGQVLIPAQYDAVGWSTGKLVIINNVTGFRLGDMWGLVNLQNNKITKAQYFELIPTEGNLIIAKKKIDRSVRIATGCINTAGKEVLPFEYDGIRVSSFRAIVFKRTGNNFNYGLINLENEPLIPLSYSEIYPLGSLRYAVENFDHKTAIFSEDGKQLSAFSIDSISTFRKDFAIIYEDQKQGLIDREGKVKLEPVYQTIKINIDGSISVKKPNTFSWLNTENKKVKEINADSIEIVDKNVLQVTNAGLIQLTDANFKPVSSRLFSQVGEFVEGKAAFKMQGTKQGIICSDGKIIAQPIYSAAEISKSHFRVKSTDRWSLLDSSGKALTQKAYQFIGENNGKFFPALLRGYWGGLDQNGKEMIACVHDSIVQVLDNLVVVEFKGKFGVIDTDERWILSPNHDRLELISNDRYLQTNGANTFLKSFKGDLIYFSENKLRFNDGHIWEYLPDGVIWKINLDGVIVDRELQAFDAHEIFHEAEGLVGVKRDDRYGFVDNKGRLRIANRYENIKDFSENLGAIKIRGKWGFINHSDNIAIQPVYDDVTSFRNGYALAKQKGFYGLINNTGKVILPMRYDTIEALTQNRFKVRQKGFCGIADSHGNTMINSKFDAITDLGNGFFITQRDGKFGVLNVQGMSVIPQQYDLLTYDAKQELFVALKRSEWESADLLR
jgi:hypothetical protein